MIPHKSLLPLRPCSEPLSSHRSSRTEVKAELEGELLPLSTSSLVEAADATGRDGALQRVNEHTENHVS